MDNRIVVESKHVHESPHGSMLRSRDIEKADW